MKPKFISSYFQVMELRKIFCKIVFLKKIKNLFKKSISREYMNNGQDN